ncbi:MAG: EamA family transporter, partial [Lawsonibacter sp.]
LSTFLFSVYGVMGKRKCAEYGGAVVTCFSFFFGSLIVLLFILMTHIPAVAQAIVAAGLPGFANIPIFAGYTAENLPYVLFVSAGVAGIGFCAYFLAMEYQPASVVSLVYFFKPALSPVLAWQLHGEEIPGSMLLGIALIVAGSLCAIIPGILEARRVPQNA